MYTQCSSIVQKSADRSSVYIGVVLWDGITVVFVTATIVLGVNKVTEP